MDEDLLVFLLVAAAAAIAAPAGGVVALTRRPTTFATSIALGFAAGGWLATVSFAMLPKALELASLSTVVAGFVAGLLPAYAFDLFVHRGRLAGEKADEHPKVERFYRSKRPRAGAASSLAGALSIEEFIEGLALGVGMAIEPRLGIVVGLAIAIDNLAEGLSIGEMIRAEQPAGRNEVRKVLAWTGTIGAVLCLGALLGWLALRGIASPLLGLLMGMAAGGTFYVVIGDLVPEAEERHFEQSSALAAAAGFLILLAVTSLA